MIRHQPRLAKYRNRGAEAVCPKCLIELVRPRNLVRRYECSPAMRDLRRHADVRMLVESTTHHIVGVADAAGESLRCRQQQQPRCFKSPAADHEDPGASRTRMAIKGLHLYCLDEIGR